MVLHFPKRRAFLPRAYDAETFPRLTFPAQCTAHYAQLAINSLCPWRIYSLPLTYTPSFSFLNGGLGTHLRARLPHLLAGTCVFNSKSGGYILLRLPRACSWIPAGAPHSRRLGGGKVGCGEGGEPLYPPAKCRESWRPKCFLEIDWG